MRGGSRLIVEKADSGCGILKALKSTISCRARIVSVGVIWSTRVSAPSLGEFGYFLEWLQSPTACRAGLRKAHLHAFTTQIVPKKICVAMPVG